MKRTRLIQTTVAAAFLAVAVSGASPARAEAASIVDGADTTGSLNDIRKVLVDYSDGTLRTVVKVTDLRTSSDGGPASMSLFVDTDPTTKGPEFRLGTGLYAGTDYQLVRMAGWKPTGDPLACRHRVTLRPGKDRIVFGIGRACLGSPDQVRIGVKMTDLWDASHPMHDWLSSPRAWSPWFAHN